MKTLAFAVCFFNIVFLPAQELVLPPRVDLLQYVDSDSSSVKSNSRYARIWGWSEDGKIAYSVEGALNSETTFEIEFVVLDLVTDNVLFNFTVYDNEWWAPGEAEVEIMLNRRRPSILDAMKTHGIIEQRTDFMPFPFHRNGTVYDAQIVDIEYGITEFWDFEVPVKYSVLVTANGKGKTIGSFIPYPWLGSVHVCGYFISPFEDRALAVVAEVLGQYQHGGVLFKFSGFHLEKGF